jgi:hypothetical protein
VRTGPGHAISSPALTVAVVPAMSFRRKREAWHKVRSIRAPRICASGGGRQRVLGQLARRVAVRTIKFLGHPWWADRREDNNPFTLWKSSWRQLPTPHPVAPASPDAARLRPAQPG